MMGLSLGHMLVVVLVIVVLFGAGKIPRLARDLGTGINAFRSGLRNGDADPAPSLPATQPAPDDGRRD